MKAVIALTASLAVANASLLPRQSISITDIPSCALQCALTSLGSTGCQTTDFACICKANAFIAGLVPCVQKGCSASDYQKTLTFAQGFCKQAGVSLSVPAGATETGTATSAAGSSSAAATTTAPTTEATGVTSASSAPTSAATSAVTSAAVQSSAAAKTTGAPTTASGSNGTVSSTSPPKPSGTEPSAANRNTALGGLGAIVALVAAFL